MANNPQVIQGTLNRLLASVVYADYAGLNVTSSYLAKEAISIGFDGDTSLLIGTLTGAVTSPEPYLFANVTMNLLRTQALGNAYKTQIETTTTLGSVTVFPDSVALSPFQLNNCVLSSIQELSFDGTTPSLIVRLRGVYSVNASLFNAS
jgi:hypothetical protein